ncbi:MAG: pyruvate dehydrogenase (acetyl-transferring) E1 component subunit alpha [Acidimicrobiia bacterium]|nr:pyruvate dehydrogenase (acetyl-transferring) E1 component subunit alpha [Acidimicrobiia bacterium]MDX2465861.1 pyruvate dehydrogenase (acetyl-transferring) E1 component subunit alpha [Acidimicrobiia bacterium]
MTSDVSYSLGEPRQLLTPEGVLVGPHPGLDEKELVEMYRLMVMSRDLDRRAVMAQRQGRLGTFAMLEGHEAVQIGSALAFGENDFIYPGYREHGVQLAFNMPHDVILGYWRGHPNQDWDVDRYRMMTITVPIASQLPHAVGHAYAARLRGENIVTGAYFGDGATSETDFHSGLNFAGVWNTPTVFICANNGYAISVPYSKQTAAESVAQKAIAYGIRGVQVDGMDPLAMYQVTREAVHRARNGEGPTLIEAICYRYGPHATADDPTRYRDDAEVEEWRPLDPVLRMRRLLDRRQLWNDEKEEVLLNESGVLFDSALARLERAELPGRDDIIRHTYDRIPQILVEQLHDLQRLAAEPETVFDDTDLWVVGEDTEPSGATENWTMAEAINAAMHQAMEHDDKLILLGEDVGLSGGVFRLTEGLQKSFGEGRVIDSPLNESGILGTAIGMAVSGSRTIAEVQFEGFVYPAFDQIASHLGRIRFRSRGHASVPVVLRFPNGAGIGAHEHHCDSPEAYFAHAPGLVVVIPSTPTDAKGLMAAALESPDPVVFMEPKVLYRAEREDVPSDHFTIPLGRARVRRGGTDITIVSYGAMVTLALQAAEDVAGEGISAEVIDLRTIYPWDFETVASSVGKTGRLLLVQEPQRSGGVAAEIAATVAERCGYSLEAPIRRLAATDAPWPQFKIEKHALLNKTQIAAAIRETVTS